MDRENEVKLLATRDEATAIIKRAKVGSTFNVRIRMDLPIEGKPDRHFPGCGASYVPVSRAEMLRLIEECLPEALEQKGARLPISYYDRMKWKRGRVGEMGKDVKATSYWLG